MTPGSLVRRAVVAWGLLAAAMLPGAAHAQDEGIEVGSRAPGFVAPTLDGTAVDLGRVIGTRPVLLEFWATWCTSCQAMLPALKAMHEQFGDEVAFYGVNVTISESRDGVRAFLEAHDPPFTTLYDEEGVAARAYNPPATSYIVIVDGAGTVVYTGSGGQQNLEPALRRVTGAPAGQ